MPSLPKIFRKKSDDRKAWRAAKAKHTKALKAKKIDFTDKLGPALDKYNRLEAKNDYKNEDEKYELVVSIAKQAKVVKDIVEGYQTLIKGKLGDPAEKALRQELQKIHDNMSFYDFMKV